MLHFDHNRFLVSLSHPRHDGRCDRLSAMGLFQVKSREKRPKPTISKDSRVLFVTDCFIKCSTNRSVTSRAKRFRPSIPCHFEAVPGRHGADGGRLAQHHDAVGEPRVSRDTSGGHEGDPRRRFDLPPEGRPAPGAQAQGLTYAQAVEAKDPLAEYPMSEKRHAQVEISNPCRRGISVGEYLLRIDRGKD